MRGILLGSVLALIAFPALSSSIEVIKHDGNKYGSIVAVRCSTCVDEPETTEKSDYNVPELAPGTQRVEIRDTENGKELVRIEAWFGGSPVRRVSYSQASLVEKDIAYREEKAKQAEIAAKQKAKKEEEEMQASRDAGIDLDAKTAAVTKGSEPVAAGMDALEKPAPFDPNKLELRLN